MKTGRRWVCASAVVVLTVCAMSSADEVSTLVAQWAFDEGGGTTVYDSVGTHHGAIVGSPTWMPGVTGQALHLNGTSDYVEVPDDAALRPGHITISAWIRIDALTNHMMVVSKSNYTTAYDEQYAVHVRVDGVYWRRVGMNIKRNSNGAPGIGWYRAYSKTLLEMDKWYLVIGTWDGTSLRMYVNGALEGREWAPPGDIDNCLGGTLRIGRWRAKDEQRFRGRIDDVRIYRGALSEVEVADLYARASGTHYVDAVDGNDLNLGNNPASAFATIQKAIDVSKDGDTVLVYPGVYTEAISFKGRAITVRSVEDAAIIQSPGLFGVSFSSGEGSQSVLKNFVIRGCPTGVFIAGSSPQLANLTVVSCGAGICCVTGHPDISNCILWGNTDADVVGCWIFYSCIQRNFPATGNSWADPLFVDAAGGDYHLCSSAGAYSALSGTWVPNMKTSPCIDAGDPEDDYALEPGPNGGRIDMGAHGGTAYASKSVKQSSTGPSAP